MCPNLHPSAALTNVPQISAFHCLLLGGCYRLQPSSGGGQAAFEPPRTVRAADVALPPGYRAAVAAAGFSFPTGVAFDADGRPHVTESGYSEELDALVAYIVVLQRHDG